MTDNEISPETWKELIGEGHIKEECDCGGPEGHVPNGIYCRKPLEESHEP